MPTATSDHRDSVKCVVIGDGAVGKTCLLISYAKGEFPRGYVPTVFDNYAVNVDVADRTVSLNLLDTAGQEDYDRLRPLSYSNANVFLLCFSVTNRDSFENIRDKWYPELRKYTTGIPFILVGTQVDRRANNTGPGNLVSDAEGARMAKELGAIKYMECSALTRDGLKAVFAQVVMTWLETKSAKKSSSKKCSIF